MIINKIGSLKITQNICRKMAEPKNFSKVNSILPTIESVFATGCYLMSIKSNNDIPQERKKPLYWQSVLPCLLGVVLSNSLNKLVKNSKNNIIKELKNKDAIKNLENVVRGVQVIIPLVITSAIMRFLVPILSVPISTYLSKHKKSA